MDVRITVVVVLREADASRVFLRLCIVDTLARAGPAVHLRVEPPASMVSLRSCSSFQSLSALQMSSFALATLVPLQTDDDWCK